MGDVTMGERILVVDDDEQVARIVRDGLTYAYPVRPATRHHVIVSPRLATTATYQERRRRWTLS